jgi:hypothetical protein
MSGSGGNFLSRFITFAKLNSTDILKLSKHGNAHAGYVELPRSILGPSDNDNLKIEQMLNAIPKGNVLPIYYVPAYILDIKLCMNFFEKVIRITYKKDDIEDITYSYLGKYQLDFAHKDKSTNVFNLYMHTLIFISKYVKDFSILEENANILYISWKELVYYDPDILINKLHNFIQIPKENFNLENLYNWRKATIFCIETLSSAK